MRGTLITNLTMISYCAGKGGSRRHCSVQPRGAVSSAPDPIRARVRARVNVSVRARLTVKLMLKVIVAVVVTVCIAELCRGLAFEGKQRPVT